MTTEHFVVAIYRDENHAHRAVEALAEQDFPLDQVSVLGRVDSSGDDVLGILHPGVNERMKVWAAQGAAWGGLLGLLAGAAGMIFLPGIGSVMIVGPLVQALAGGMTGAAMGGGGMGAAAALSQLGVAMHRHGIPETELERLHRAIKAGQYLILLKTPADRTDAVRHPLQQGDPLEVTELGPAQSQ
ncbi:MAG: hypothetical protein P8Y64_02905 [Gammaproteobacteria bacterium]|jgi:hypothetical protein